jgi:hypothetical protein
LRPPTSRGRQPRRLATDSSRRREDEIPPAAAQTVIGIAINLSTSNPWSPAPWTAVLIGPKLLEEIVKAASPDATRNPDNMKGS